MGKSIFAGGIESHAGRLISGRTICSTPSIGEIKSACNQSTSPRRRKITESLSSIKKTHREDRCEHTIDPSLSFIICADRFAATPRSTTTTRVPFSVGSRVDRIDRIRFAENTNGMKNGNRFSEHSSGRCEGGRHDDYRSATEREARGRGAGRRRRAGPQCRGSGRTIGSHRDTHLGILHQS